ncbi:MAG TPA: DNA-directed RNA polymerase subunit alpha [Thermoanaerobaculia bacterium]|nr:DNA-directed RNA polymerase subunit alpha [Thermoanaerobaculia bacterium]HUM30666.1 DNA-directed RNA polymerase subunit alpha [Thermoanaerobaculia bacterium]HXK68926.1 DNA-directed RNA polymerase subunit alpha [Thermoanaerobaculia bacterium]
MTSGIFQMPAALNVDKETLSTTYGKFWAQPFERGWGITVGNAMRRILLSSIEGAAFTNVKIHGAMHEFSTLPGVKEDVTQILLNVKSIPVRMHSETPKTLYVKKSGPGALVSGDIETDQDVEILNPDIHLATLDEDGEIEMWLRVRMGRGYIPAENNREEDLDIGFLPIDSIHSPVTKVNFQIFPARVGRISTYDKLVLEVWTNGTFEPAETVQMASSLLKSHMDIFSGAPEALLEGETGSAGHAPPVVETEVVDETEALMTRSVEELDIPSRIINNLKKAKIFVIEDLTRLTYPELLKTENFGKKSVSEIIRALKEMGITLTGAPDTEEA